MTAHFFWSVMNDDVKIRYETPSEWDAVRRVNQAAFGTPLEANLVDVLRMQAEPAISLVAIEAEKVVGHILFTPVDLEGRPDMKIMGLAPMAVLPERQHRGIGKTLVETGLEECRKLGIGAVVVLGHPGYYPQFGFAPASGFGIRSEYEAPDDAFMLLELRPGAMRGTSGTVRYHPAFNSV